LRTPRLGLHALRGLINGCSQLCFFMAIVMIPLAQVSALNFTAPLFTTVTAVIVLGEVIRVRRITALAVGFAGTWLILRPGVVAVELGSLLALLGSLGWGVTMIAVKILSRTDSAISITFYGALFISPIALIAAIPFWQTPTLVELGWLVVIAVLATLVHLCFNQAIKEADLTVLLPFNFASLIWAAIIGYLVFAEMPTIWTWVGGAIIFISGTYLVLRESRLKGAPSTVPSPGA
jgi:drug/metabolite transporter (DMT)-like permease